MKKSQNLENNFIFWLTICFMTLFTEIFLRLRDIPSFIFPKPTEIFRGLMEDKELLLSHTLTTVYEAFIGFTISIILSLIIGALIYDKKRIKEILYPFLLISQTVPLIAVAPLILIWFGFGIFPKIIIVVVICLFPILISFLDGLNSVNQEVIDLFKVMRARKIDIFRKCLFPASLPSLFAGLKISVTYSVMGAVIGEWLGAEKGLGIYMTRALSSFRTDYLFSAIIIVVIISLILFKIIELIEKFVLRWKG